MVPATPQAPIVMVEDMLIRYARCTHVPALPYVLRVVLTNAALIAVAGPLFFGPADTTGFAGEWVPLSGLCTGFIRVAAGFKSPHSWTHARVDCEGSCEQVDEHIQ
jgi:hypothetical protein